MSPDLSDALGIYVARRTKEHSSQPDAALFLTRKGIPLARYTAENVFRRLRVRVGVVRHDSSHYQPRLHDLRQRADFRVMPTCQAESVWMALEAP
jgi:hypothetical protein